MGMYDQNGYGNRGGGDGNRGAFSGRLIMAIIIALIGLFTYWSQQQENPVTGERQHISLTPSEEIKLGLQTAPEMAHQMGGELPDSNPQVQEVRRLGQQIVAQSPAKKGPWQFQFHVVNDSKTVNAFALPGGQVFITLGLLNKLQTEAQLAGVLSHEMGHVIERHSAEQMAQSQLGQTLVGAVATGVSDRQDVAQSTAMIAQMANQMIQLRYSRKDESEADIWGIKLMVLAGFDPKAMIEVMEILKAEEGSGHSMEMFQTHPHPDLRIATIKAYLKEHPQPANLSQGRKLR